MPTNIPTNTLTQYPSTALVPTPQATGTLIDLSGDVYVAFWLNDETALIGYRPFTPADRQLSLQWARLDASTQAVTATTAPYDYNPMTWESLGVLNPAVSGFDPEVRRLISPTGRYAIFSTRQGADCFSSTTRTYVWIADLRQLHKVQIAQRRGCDNVYEVAWLKDETQAIFTIGLEGPPLFYLVDIMTSQMTLLDKIVGSDVVTDDEWTVAPDGSMLALLDRDQDYQIRLIALDKGGTIRLDQFGKGLSWSSDSVRVYYWLGQEPLDIAGEELRSYDIQTGQISTVIKKTAIQVAFSESSQSAPNENYGILHVAVSPSENKVLLWDSRLWLIRIVEQLPP